MSSYYSESYDSPYGDPAPTRLEDFVILHSVYGRTTERKILKAVLDHSVRRLRKLGSGAFSSCYQWSRNTAIKTNQYSSDSDSGAVHFLKFCIAENSRHLPAIFFLAVNKAENRFVAVMEELVRFPDEICEFEKLADYIDGVVGNIRGNYDKEHICSQIQEKLDRKFLMASIHEEVAGVGNSVKKLMFWEFVKFAAKKKQANSLTNVSIKLAELSSRSNLGCDLHTGNFMLRKDGTIIINDPFCG